jgi:hypothetical protein
VTGVGLRENRAQRVRELMPCDLQPVTCDESARGGGDASLPSPAGLRKRNASQKPSASGRVSEFRHLPRPNADLLAFVADHHFVRSDGQADLHRAVTAVEAFLGADVVQA